MRFDENLDPIGLREHSGSRDALTRTARSPAEIPARQARERIQEDGQVMQSTAQDEQRGERRMHPLEDVVVESTDSGPRGKRQDDQDEESHNTEAVDYAETVQPTVR